MKDRRKLYRILDANFNRAREGLRVCEDLKRFADPHPRTAESLKRLRHAISKLTAAFDRKAMLKARDSRGDLGRRPHPLEMNRKNCEDIYGANLQRSKEALRVLEEVLKVISPSQSKTVKSMRFKLYEIEKQD